MDVREFTDIIGADFYVGVPDSQLKPLCDFLMERYGIDGKHHLIAANEGNCAALAAGYHLTTGKIPVVYMQNSGEGNIINPAASLLDGKVYGIPVIFVIGWRGEPGLHDEPQHICQGEITLKLLEVMGIRTFVVKRDTTAEELRTVMTDFREALAVGEDVAFVIGRDAISYSGTVEYRNGNNMRREEILAYIVNAAGDDPIISTTGKTSRELFEIREKNGQGHERDFLTVGSMGHSSSIALGVALHKPESRVWCVDGDGAVLMHMGAMAVIGSRKPPNLIHVLINNSAHESVGGMPTAAGTVDWPAAARACGYSYAAAAADFRELRESLEELKQRRELGFLEVKCAIGARSDLGRPTGTPQENKRGFMDYLRGSRDKELFENNLCR